MYDCPYCEQGKHQNCTKTVLAEGIPIQPRWDRDTLRQLIMTDENWVPCPCAERGH